MPKISYQIIPLHHVCDTQKDLLNEVYGLWEDTFGRVLNRAGVELDHDDFFRCHAAGVLLYKNEIVGFNLFTTFDLNLRAHQNHNYFKELDPQFVKSVTKMGNKIMTMEYFTLAPLWRKQSQEIPWGEILTGLGLFYMDESPADFVVGTPRVDLKVDTMCKRLGATIQGHVEKMNYKCAIAVFEKKDERSFENPLTHHWVRKLWAKYTHHKEEKLAKQKQGAAEAESSASPPPFELTLAEAAA
ncbi:hypothetical protein ACES2I_15340 [Bdellovibrio bacteriovorus]|uniref:hypothetical protein n=1 Tax=Bdellovibrio bacteriovorus TaxID=959 RepID=UPI0035A6CBA0